jgi:cell division cycle protein 20 (cofactor of APC complex)
LQAPAAPAAAPLAVGGRTTAPAPAPASTRRPIPQAPSRVLDAPGLVDDFYCNLLAWAPSAAGPAAASAPGGGLLAVALGPAVYLWDAASGTVSALGGGERDPAAEGDYVSSVAWAADGAHLAVGVAGTAEVQVWDAAAGRQLRSLRGHGARVGAAAWNGACLATGSRDSVVLTHDVR